MQLRQAKRKNAKIKLGLFGAAGSGKTFSALKLAYGLCKDWSKVAIICTEKQDDYNHAADQYDFMGEFNVLPLDAPFRPERYIDAISQCEAAGMDVIIIDSISHEWEGQGGLLDESDKMAGNSFTNWNSLGRRHKSLVDKILTSTSHIITCGRTKTDYVLEENEKGKMVPKKVGTKVITREGFDFEIALAFDIDASHYARCSKDRTHLFADCEPFRIDEATGEKLAEWCANGYELTEEEIAEREEKQLRTEIGKLIEQKGLSVEQASKITGLDTTKGKTLDELIAAREALQRVA